MAFIFSSVLNWLRSLFFAKHLEVTIVGLQASGKTSLVNVLGSDQWSEDVVPTVAFNLRQVRKGNVTMKVWDVAGQPKFRGMWDRYCRGADAIIYVVDAADPKSLPTATSELHALLALPALSSVPLLVLANKNDLPDAVGVDDLIKEMRLGEIGGRVVSVSENLKIIRERLGETLGETLAAVEGLRKLCLGWKKRSRANHGGREGRKEIRLGQSGVS